MPPLLGICHVCSGASVRQNCHNILGHFCITPAVPALTLILTLKSYFGFDKDLGGLTSGT